MDGRPSLAHVLAALGLACAALLLLPTASQAGVTTERDTGGVSKSVAKRYKLTRKERRALDIVSFAVTGP